METPDVWSPILLNTIIVVGIILSYVRDSIKKTLFMATILEVTVGKI